MEGAGFACGFQEGVQGGVFVWVWGVCMRPGGLWGVWWGPGLGHARSVGRCAGGEVSVSASLINLRSIVALLASRVLYFVGMEFLLIFRRGIIEGLSSCVIYL